MSKKTLNLVLVIAVAALAIWHWGPYFLITVLAISFLIFFHELGHFLAARQLGVVVETFSVGFGDRVYSKKVGDTEYCISAIPLGGYVKLRGQDDSDPTLKNYDEGSYTLLSPLGRIYVLFAGPFFNILLAFLLYVALGYIGVEKVSPVVGYVLKDSAAMEAGIKKGDKILEIGGQKIQDWDEIKKFVGLQSTDVVIKRDSQILTLNLTPKIGETYTIFNEKVQKPLIGIAQRGSTTLTYENGTKIDAKSYKATIDKNSKQLVLEGTATPNSKLAVKFFDDSTKSFYSDENGKFKVISDAPMQDVEYVTIYNKGFSSITFALDETIKASKLIVIGLEKLITGVVPIKEMGGIVAMTDITTKAASISVSVLFIIVALISVNLGILNLLPIPVLDGGHIVFNIYELLFKKPVSQRVFAGLSYAGMAFLFALMAFTIINDFLRLSGVYNNG
ncbi:RIP metalloprotease RseP [Campylobacter geochelonis]|uniref:Zinc metalloprotease n=1 Tax=Campylobacter geochelonis TaxID=1780362 RepID=A0A128EI31_9BACT|nr:RIP metalloprotease RseP [Campylobacter geochelonis]QKF71336.1 RseP-like zinc metalloprotease, M50 family [Campylobacter geochelonis]CZE48231.1 RIP metalloprotease RseP [Campylobacter geochelonis]